MSNQEQAVITVKVKPSLREDIDKFVDHEDGYVNRSEFARAAFREKLSRERGHVKDLPAKLPEGFWICPRCRTINPGSPVCMDCGMEAPEGVNQ